jgi:putative FmdB family regulatory protein
MPIYEYICDDCRNPFERIVLNKTEQIACPKCGSDKHTLQFSVVNTSIRGNGGSMPSAGGGCCSSSGCGCG